MNDLSIDLHLHTRCSDGIWETDRLLEEVRARCLDVFSITDHDSVGAYPLPDEFAERAIPGLEVDSHHGGHTVHVLAYGIDRDDTPLLTALAAQRSAREARMEAMLEQVNGRGVQVTMADVRAQAAGTRSLGRPHLARALVVRGAVATVQEAFDVYLADDAPAYVALERLTTAEAIGLIHRSGGVAVVAHPARLHGKGDLEELIAAGVDGIEIVHPTADVTLRDRLRALAREHDLLVTAGTDFHAPVEGRPIGVPFERDAVDRLRATIARRAEMSLREGV